MSVCHVNVIYSFRCRFSSHEAARVPRGDRKVEVRRAFRLGVDLQTIGAGAPAPDSLRAADRLADRPLVGPFRQRLHQPAKENPAQASDGIDAVDPRRRPYSTALTPKRRPELGGHRNN